MLLPFLFGESMCNIILTTDCQRKCKYCFAKNNSRQPMSFQKGYFAKAIDWIINDNDLISRVGLLGGEPTLHPKFLEFLDYTLSKRLNTIVFTNGMIKNREFIFDIINTAIKNNVKHSEQLCFCININEQKYRNAEEQKLQEQFLELLGKVSVVSFNIFEEKCNFGFLVDLINKYEMIRTIRLGLAAPLGNRNSFIKPDNYKTIGKKIAEFTDIRVKENISIGFDCGFPKCMFTEAQFEKIQNSPIEVSSFDCGPSIDIYPNLTVSSCYPLSEHYKTDISKYSYSELFYKWTKEMKTIPPIYNKCYDCNWFKTKCGGGCRAHKIYG